MSNSEKIHMVKNKWSLSLSNIVCLYSQISNIRQTKSQHLNVSRLILPLSQSIEAMC